MVIKVFISLILLSALCGCSARRDVAYWRVKDMVLGTATIIELQGRNEQIMASIPKRTLQELMLAHLRISRAARIEAELLIVDGSDPNAFAGIVNQRPAIGINLGMIKLIGDDISQYAALLGHEAAHWAKGHVDASKLRANTLDVIGTLVSVGLSAAGVPASGLITGLSLDLIDASYSRDEEREADTIAIDYVLASNHDPQGAVTLFEKMMQQPRGFGLPFLSSHPSDQERIDNFRALIERKKSAPVTQSLKDNEP